MSQLAFDVTHTIDVRASRIWDNERVHRPHCTCGWAPTDGIQRLYFQDARDAKAAGDKHLAAVGCEVAA